MCIHGNPRELASGQRSERTLGKVKSLPVQQMRDLTQYMQPREGDPSLRRVKADFRSQFHPLRDSCGEWLGSSRFPLHIRKLFMLTQDSNENFFVNS